jgi:hypothetical protein
MLIFLHGSVGGLVLLLLIANLFEEQGEQLGQVLPTFVCQRFPGDSLAGEEHELSVRGLAIHEYLRTRKSCSKVPPPAWWLQTVGVEDRLNGAQRVEVTDGIDAAAQLTAGVLTSHPFGNGNVVSAGMDFKE